MAIFTTLALAGGAAALGAGSGALSGVLGKSGSSRQRRRVRTGINVGQQQTGRQIGALMNSPEIQAMQDFLYGLYGIDPNAPSGQRGLGSAQTLQGVSVVDPDQPSQGVKFKSLGKAGARAVQSTVSQIAEYDRARRLQESGVELSPAEQARVDQAMAGAESGDLVKSLEGMSGLEQNFVARFLQEREGIGAQDFNQIFGQLRETAGLEPQVATDRAGADFSKALDPNINPLAANFQKSIQQAQASRGLFASNAAAAAEASGLSSFIFQQQQANLGNLQNLATLDIGGFAQGLEAHNIQTQTALFTGGGSVAGPGAGVQALQGGLSGLFAGASMGLNAANLFGGGQQAAAPPISGGGAGLDPALTAQFGGQLTNPAQPIPNAARLANDFEDQMLSSQNLFGGVLR
jgi:hypothetical protein